MRGKSRGCGTCDSIKLEGRELVKTCASEMAFPKKQLQ